jgi:hypothetical protein
MMPGLCSSLDESWGSGQPQDNAILRFAVTYRDKLLEVEIGVEKVEYTLREGETWRSIMRRRRLFLAENIRKLSDQ